MSQQESFLASLADLRESLAPADLAAIVLALLLIRLARHAGMWVYALVALPGTAVHELAHFLVAFLLGARPSFPALLPQRNEGRWRLGEVRFRAGYVRALFVALAPMSLAPIALWWMTKFLAQSSWPWYVAHVWIVAALLTACWPSKADWKLALPAIAVLILALALVGWYYLTAQR